MPMRLSPVIAPTNPLDSVRNIWQYTEDVGSDRYTVTSAAKGTATVNYKGITLTQVTSSNYYGALSSQINGLGLTPFVTGTRYLVSCYALSLGGTEQTVWMRNLGLDATYGHGPKLVDNRVRRLWMLAQATDTSHLDQLVKPTVALGSGTGTDTYWMFVGQSAGVSSLSAYLGGFQIEQVPSTYVDGVALIGDSTMAGGSGGTDAPGDLEVSTWASMLLNVPFFNRAVGGYTTTDMVTNWSTLITPVSANAKYCIIQGGINDIGAATALATIQANINTMVSNAISDGMVPIVCTCTPLSTTYALQTSYETERQSLNSWIRETFPLVLDLDAIVHDQDASYYVRNQTGWLPTDGSPHYVASAKRAIGRAIAQWPHWNFTTPTPYQPVLVTTPALMTAQQAHGSLAWEIPTPGPTQPLGVWQADGAVWGLGTLASNTDQPPQIVLNGTTAGTLNWVQQQVGVTKRWIGYLDGYENTTVTAQTVTFPFPFTAWATITSQPAGFGAVATVTTLTLPASMASAVTGGLVVEGM